MLAQILKLHLRKSYAQAKQMAEKVQQQSNKAVYNKRAPMNKRNEYGQQKQFFFLGGKYRPISKDQPSNPKVKWIRILQICAYEHF